MSLRRHEAESQVTWYECGACKRMWSKPKDGRDAPQTALNTKRS